MSSIKFNPITDVQYAIEILMNYGYTVLSASSTGAVEFDIDVTESQIAEVQAILDTIPDINITEIRSQRTGKLYECDWTQLVDAPLSDGQKQQWKIYRKALRDLPEQLLILTEGQQWSWPIPPTNKE